MNGARAEEFLAGLYAAGARDHAAAAESSRRAGSSGAAADASAVGACIEQVDRRAQLHRLAILWLVCRPAALALAPVLLCAVDLPPPLRLVLGACCWLALWWAGNVISQFMVRTRGRRYRAGVFHNGSGPAGGRTEAILKRAAFLRPARPGGGAISDDLYTAPAWYMDGDWATVAAGLVAPEEQPRLRLLFPLEEGRHVMLDVFGLEHDAATAAPAQPVFLVLPGIGSDSSFPPAQDLARAAREQGSICVVMNPLGLRCDDLQRSVLFVHDITRVDLLHTAVEAVCKAAGTAPVVLAGYSLGGITLASYLGRCAAPHNIAGCICVSGALKTDFISSSHYLRFYQPIIVAGLVRDLLVKYGAEMLAILGVQGLASLASARSYFDLQQRFYGSLPFPPRARQLYCWWAAVEGWSWRKCVDVPLLIVTALDDPLHRSSSSLHSLVSHPAPHLSPKLACRCL